MITIEQLQIKIGDWFDERPLVDMDLEYNQRELAERCWHWMNDPEDDAQRRIE